MKLIKKSVSPWKGKTATISFHVRPKGTKNLIAKFLYDYEIGQVNKATENRLHLPEWEKAGSAAKTHYLGWAVKLQELLNLPDRLRNSGVANSLPTEDVNAIPVAELLCFYCKKPSGKMPMICPDCSQGDCIRAYKGGQSSENARVRKLLQREIFYYNGFEKRKDLTEKDKDFLRERERILKFAIKVVARTESESTGIGSSGNLTDGKRRGGSCETACRVALPQCPSNSVPDNSVLYGLDTAWHVKKHANNEKLYKALVASLKTKHVDGMSVAECPCLSCKTWRKEWKNQGWQVTAKKKV